MAHTRWRCSSFSARVPCGEVVGNAGLVGSGRTEFIRAIFGLDPVRRGIVTVGTFTGPATPGVRWQQGVGMLSAVVATAALGMTVVIISGGIDLSVGSAVALDRLRHKKRS